ncbi:hypothetical protein D9V86_12035, partial [Bacteroidetes/Chlorobi group bacterium ChocPot_Mid]
MSLLNKIRRTKDNQLERYNAGKVNPMDTSFFPWVKQALGKLNLLVSRKFYEPHNVLEWNIPAGGISESNLSIDPGDDYGLKFSDEIVRGDLAKIASIEGSAGFYDMWSFFCGVSGNYDVGVILKVEYESQSVANTYYMYNPQLEQPTLRLAINGQKLIEPIAFCNGLKDDGLTHWHRY